MALLRALNFFAAPVIAALAIAALAGEGRADTYPRQPGVDAQHYVFRIALTDAGDEISGEATVTLLFLKEGTTKVSLDLAQAMAVTSLEPPLTYTHLANCLTVTLASSPKAGESRSFTIRYRGTPVAGLRIGLNKYGERTFFSSNWPDKAREWLPLIDHPYDKATSEFMVTAPAKYQVICNGRLLETVDLGNGQRLTHWRQSIPIASWLNTVGVAQFAVRNFSAMQGIPLQTWVFHQDRDPGIETFEKPTLQAMTFFTDSIGPFPYEKLADVEAAGVNGGMEFASAIFYGDKSVGKGPATNLVSHEIAHQWFGDSVTEKDWDDVWLSEGFATYFALLTTEHYQGRDAFVAGLKNSRDRVFAAEEQNPGVAVRHSNLSDMSKVLNQVVYQKGGWMLHMLRSEIGTDNFWRGIREYYGSYRDSNASTINLQRVMEKAAGRNLTQFFDQWLNWPGSPVVEGTWHYDSSSKLLAIDLAQKQGGKPYHLPLEIAIDGRTERLDMVAKRQHFSIRAEKEPSAIGLDPNTAMLMHATFARDSHS